MGWWCKHTTQAARTHGARKGKGDFAEYSVAPAAVAAASICAAAAVRCTYGW